MKKIVKQKGNKHPKNYRSLAFALVLNNNMLILEKDPSGNQEALKKSLAFMRPYKKTLTILIKNSDLSKLD